MKIWLDLFIGLSKEGEPLPRLKIRVGEDTYEVFDGKPIKDWRPGSMTGHSTSIEVASPPEADQRDAVLEEAAKVCEDMQIAKDSTVPDGKWRTLGDTEIDGRKFAVAIRSLKRPSRSEGSK